MRSEHPKKIIDGCLLPALLSVVLVFLVSCGSGENEHARIELNGNAIVWTGYADADVKLKADFDATRACLEKHSLRIRPGYAYVVVIDGMFFCNGVPAQGCAELSGDRIYMDKASLNSNVFSHEVVHWATRMGNSFHNTDIFNACIQDTSAENGLSSGISTQAS